MLHPAARAVEEYYAKFNRKDWHGTAGMFDLPAMVVVGPRKVVLDDTEAVTALYLGLDDKFAREGAARLSWDPGSFTVVEVHADLAVVKAVVTRETVEHVPVKTWNCSYTARLTDRAWRFLLVTSDDAGNAKVI